MGPQFKIEMLLGDQNENNQTRFKLRRAAGCTAPSNLLVFVLFPSFFLVDQNVVTDVLYVLMSSSNAAAIERIHLEILQIGCEK